MLHHRTRHAAGADLFLSIHHDSVKERLLPRADEFSGFSLFVSRHNPQMEKSLACASQMGKALRDPEVRRRVAAAIAAGARDCLAKEEK